MKEKTSQYVGVSFHKERARGSNSNHGQWLAKIYKDGKQVVIGLFDDERTAAMARDKFILRHQLDFPLQILKKK